MRISSITKNAGKACNNRLYRHIRTFEKIVKNYFVIYRLKPQIYETLEKYILNSNKQVFVVMLKDKLKYITGKHNLIELNKPILDKTKYDELLGEFTYMRKL